MKRTLIFVVVAPVSVFVVVFCLGVAGGGKSPGFIPVIAAVLALLTIAVAALAGALDAYLARAFAIPLRAPLIATVGAIIASGLASGLSYMLFDCLPPPELLAYVAIGGAACMGMCSLLANDYGWRQSVAHANSLLRH